jgi:hypothetical protein
MVMMELSCIMKLIACDSTDRSQVYLLCILKKERKPIIKHYYCNLYCARSLVYVPNARVIHLINGSG